MRVARLSAALLLAAVLLVSPFSLKALTSAELNAEIQALLAEIAALQGQLKGLAPSPAPTYAPAPAPYQTPTAPYASPTYCLVALPPATACSTGWKPITDSAGCTQYYQCAIPLPKFEPSEDVSLKASPDEGDSPLRVKFTLDAKDSTLKSGVRYSIDFDDGKEQKFPRKKNPSLSHTYKESGEYEVSVTRETKCTATRCSGESAEVASITIQVD